MYYLFVTDRLKRLVGVLNLRQLIVAAPTPASTKLWTRMSFTWQPDTDQEECADLMQRYNLLALPVVDARKHLLGVITIDGTRWMLFRKRPAGIFNVWAVHRRSIRLSGYQHFCHYRQTHWLALFVIWHCLSSPPG